MMTTPLFSPFTFPNGASTKNRIVKAAMEENMANEKQQPDSQLFNLYRTWANGGTGLIITGNVMVDKLAMTGPGGVVLEKSTDLSPFIQWAKSAKENNTRVWMQINHPGRQVFAAMGGKALAPSAIPLNMGKHSKLFAQPKAMTETEILDVIQRFVDTAKQAQNAGFDGVEVHAAHGYLISQFLSPLTNKREDSWGGSIENRAKILTTILKEIRQACGENFDIAVKLNSADFQRGGFDIDDAEQVIKMLEPLAIDMVELSGGSYEAPAMQGKSADSRTLAREAYFLEFAQQIAKSTSIPIMTTGGIKRKAVAENVLESNVSLVGIASALAYTPNLANMWQNNNDKAGFIPQVTWKNKTLSAMAVMALIKRQLKRIGKGKKPKINSSPFWSLLLDQRAKSKLTQRYRNNTLND